MTAANPKPAPLRFTRLSIFYPFGPSHKWQRWFASFLSAAVFFAAEPVGALDVETFAGYSTDFGLSSFSYAGIGLEQPISEKFNLRARLFLSFLTYRFKADGETVKAQAPAVSPLIGLKYRVTDDMSLSVFAGGQFKETRFLHHEPSKRNDNGAVTQLEFFYQLSPRADLLVLYMHNFAESFNWGRLTVKREVLALGPRDELLISLGLEGVGIVGKDFKAGYGGLLTELRHRPTGASLLLGIGPKHSDAEGIHETRPNLSLNFYFRF